MVVVVDVDVEVVVDVSVGGGSGRTLKSNVDTVAPGARLVTVTVWKPAVAFAGTVKVSGGSPQFCAEATGWLSNVT